MKIDMVNADRPKRKPAKRGPMSQETREKLLAANLGKPCSPETREKLRAAAIDKPTGVPALLTGSELADYRVLTRKGGYTRAEALAAIGRADLVQKFAAHNPLTSAR